MDPAIAQVSTLAASFDDDVRGYSAAGFQAMEIWWTKLEAFLQSHSLDDAVSLMADHGLAAPVAAAQGGLFTPAPEARHEAWELFRRRLAQCPALGCRTFVVSGDVAGPVSMESLKQLVQWLQQAAELAAPYEVRLAYEFQARAAAANNLQTACSLVQEVGHPNVGICLDMFHFSVGPSKLADLAGLTSDILFHVQLCDLPPTLREFATDSQRILPGDGDLPLPSVIARLREIHYTGAVSLELGNPRLAQVDPRSLADAAFRSLQRIVR